MKFLLFILTPMWLITTGRSVAAESVSQFGITWEFSADRPTGRFANGDWWVVGPVTITRITPGDPTPGDSTDIHGTMINPIPAKQSPWRGIHGWDSRIRDNTYIRTLNIARTLPYTVPAGSSVMSCRSVEAQVSGNNLQMDTIAILTVLASAPPEGSFRPPYIGTDKSVRWNKSQLDYSKLKKLAPVPSTPALGTVETWFEKAHIALTPMWVGTYLHTVTGDNPGYGREISHKCGAGALLLNLNYSNAQKETLLVRMVQRGIDIYGIRAQGSGWWADGGHHHGRKFPMVLAGLVLGDASILSLVNGPFAEDGQHFYVTQEDVDRTRKPGRAPYTTAMIGMPEWGGKHVGEPEGDGSAWDTPYRVLVGVSNMGPVLAARLMGIEAQWKHPATFDYMDRFYSVEAGNVSNSVNSIQPFVSDMWKTYRSKTGGVTTQPEPVIPPPAFAIGQRIATTRTTNVRASGALGGSLLGTQVTGAKGTLTGGPVTADGITWWQVNYDEASDGWSGADNFTLSGFVVGERVEVWRNTNVRSSGKLSGTLLGAQGTGSAGTVIAGPVTADNITWWQVNYDTGADGWSGADNFIGTGKPAPLPPTPPKGLRVIEE